MVFDGLAAGCAGIISGSTNAFATKVQEALAASGDEREATVEAVKSARAVAARYPMVAAMKRIQAWRSGDDGWLRTAPPLVPLSPAQVTALRADLDALAGASGR